MKRKLPGNAHCHPDENQDLCQPTNPPITQRPSQHLISKKTQPSHLETPASTSQLGPPQNNHATQHFSNRLRPKLPTNGDE
jgi:hypothetical protein